MKNTKQAFTLVELIVVITILAILGTIAFVSLAGYSKDSRNSVRVSDVSLINTSLELFSIPVGKYPSPSNATNISSGATIVGYMGTVGESVTTQLKKLSKQPLDPKSNEAYEYSITASKREFQVMYQLEDGLANVTSQANAASTIPELKGNYNELYTISEDGSEYFALPSLFPVNPDLTQAEGFVMNNESAAVAFTAKSLGAKPTTSTGYIDFTKALQNAYTGSLFSSKPAYTALKAINTTDTGALETFTKASFGLLTGGSKNIINNNSNNLVVETVDPGWMLVDTNCTIPDIVLGTQTWAGCNSTLGVGYEYGNGTGKCFNYLGVEVGGSNCWGNTTSERSYFDTIDFGVTTPPNEGSFDTVFGKMYTHAGANVIGESGVCRGGYHLPSLAEFSTLTNYLGGGTNLGWDGHDSLDSTNNMVEALKIPLAGYLPPSGAHNHRGNHGVYWASDSGSYLQFTYNSTDISYLSIGTAYAFSVRCIKD